MHFKSYKAALKRRLRSLEPGQMIFDLVGSDAVIFNYSEYSASIYTNYKVADSSLPDNSLLVSPCKIE